MGFLDQDNSMLEVDEDYKALGKKKNNIKSRINLPFLSSILPVYSELGYFHSNTAVQEVLGEAGIWL